MQAVLNLHFLQPKQQKLLMEIKLSLGHLEGDQSLEEMLHLQPEQSLAQGRRPQLLSAWGRRAPSAAQALHQPSDGLEAALRQERRIFI